MKIKNLVAGKIYIIRHSSREKDYFIPCTEKTLEYRGARIELPNKFIFLENVVNIYYNHSLKFFHNGKIIFVPCFWFSDFDLRLEENKQ